MDYTHINLTPSRPILWNSSLIPLSGLRDYL
jgi:hypothetical protein